MRAQGWQRPRAVSGRLLAPLLGVAGWLYSAGTSAQPARSYDWLRRYEVAAECPSEQAFRQMLGARVARPLAQAFARLRLGVKVEHASGGGWRGRLEVKDEADVATTREVEGSSCASLLEALSLVAAVAGDDTAPLEPEAAAVAPRDHGVSPLEPSSGRHALRIGPSVQLLADSSLAPRTASGWGVGVRLDWPGEGLYRPSLQLAGTHLQGSRELQNGGILARFEVAALNATLCPLELLGSNTWSVRPCAGFDAGRISGGGTGPGLLRHAQRRGAWFAGGLALQGSVALWGPLSLSTSLGATLPLARHEFFFAPDTLAFRVPALGWRLAGSIAALF